MPLLMCPNCNASMTEVKRNDVAFDMCPTCRGVWLDRGELEKIIAGVQGEFQRERATAFAPQQQQPPQQPAYQQPQQRYPEQGYGERGEQGEGGDYTDQQGRGRRRGGFDLFDIFD